MADDEVAMAGEGAEEPSAADSATEPEAAAAENSGAEDGASDGGNDEASAEEEGGDEEEADANADEDGDAEEEDESNDAEGAEAEDPPVEKVDSDAESAPENEGDDGAPPPEAEAKSGEKRPAEETKGADDEPLPTLPLKRARTAYFIFADAKREEVREKHKGEGVAGMAKAIGQLWGALEPDEKKVYEDQAAAERARVARDTQRLKDAGLWPAAGAAGGNDGDDDAPVIPVGRVRKICKLDPEVKGMSKESALLITRATEMFTTKLGKECVTMAAMQNRRKLLPDDVVEVCAIKERFMFLKQDLVDLRKAQIEEAAVKEKENGKEKEGRGKTAEEMGSKPLDSYFGKARN
ncbi:hypothetical protein ACHAXT_003009 [Thalassiosira profunda]